MAALPDYLLPRYKKNLKRCFRGMEEPSTSSCEPPAKVPSLPVVAEAVPAIKHVKNFDVKPIHSIRQISCEPPAKISSPAVVTEAAADFKNVKNVVVKPILSVRKNSFQKSASASKSPERASSSPVACSSSSTNADIDGDGALGDSEDSASMQSVEPEAPCSSKQLEYQEHYRKVAQYAQFTLNNIRDLYNTIPDDKLQQFHFMAMAAAEQLKEKYLAMNRRTVLQG